MKRAFVLLLLVGCGQQAFQDKSAQADKPTEPALKVAGQDVKVWPKDAKTLEKIVSDYVVGKAHNPKSVEFLEWGPHDLEGVARLSFNFLDRASPNRTVRVIFKRNNAYGDSVTSDMLFVVSQGIVVLEVPNNFKEHWLKLTTTNTKF